MRLTGQIKLFRIAIVGQQIQHVETIFYRCQVVDFSVIVISLSS